MHPKDSFPLAGRVADGRPASQLAGSERFVKLSRVTDSSRAGTAGGSSSSRRQTADHHTAPHSYNN